MTLRQQAALAGSAVAFLVGLVLCVLGWQENPDRLGPMLTGLSLMIAAVVGCVGTLLWRLLCERIRPLDQLFEEGRQIGYNRGYWDGRKEARPVVVTARCPHCNEPLNKAG